MGRGQKGGPRTAHRNFIGQQGSRSLVYDDVRGILYTAGDFWTPVVRGVGIFVEKLNPGTGDRITWNPANNNPFVFVREILDGLQLDFATGIALDREGSIYVSGYEIANDNEVSSNAGDATYLVFKVDSSANLLWTTMSSEEEAITAA